MNNIIVHYDFNGKTHVYYVRKNGKPDKYLAWEHANDTRAKEIFSHTYNVPLDVVEIKR